MTNASHGQIPQAYRRIESGADKETRRDAVLLYSLFQKIGIQEIKDFRPARKIVFETAGSTFCKASLKPTILIP